MDFLHTPANGQEVINARLVLAPGSMGPMDNPTLTLLSQLLAQNGVSVTRFEFAYMAQRRHGGSKRPPPRAERLIDEYRAAIALAARDAQPGERLLIGGKSLGGRVASMIADELFASGRVQGLVCFGYPFHPPGKPDRLRTAHLGQLSCPCLIVQGIRDPFGDHEEVAGYQLSDTIHLHWAVDGNHDLEPRKKSGMTHEANLAAAAKATANFAAALPPPP